MAKVSLRMYNREIEGLIEHGQLDEAIAHCRHILKTFPKHLETYRLLGKAYLEAKRYSEAVDIFQRVLVAAPDDFVAQVGMSIIADDQGRLDEAIWHMERAFEVQPSNAAIQGELQRLFGRRDGVEPPKIRLTRGALAHMYVQGELYTQAISEIQAVLGGDPKRTDMQVLLARAYFHNGQKTEATEICTQLLKRLEYCLDVNRLMAAILPGTQRADAAQEYLQRVKELDPYAAFVQDSVFNAGRVADSAVTLERFEYSGQAVDLAPNWGGTLGIGLESDSTAVGRASDQPEWLRDASAPEVPAAPAAGGEAGIPDFLRQAGWSEATGEATEGPSSAEEAESEPAAVQGDLPDWVKALAPEEPAETPSESVPPPDETPDWLHNLGSVESAEPSAAEAVQAKETPDWLKNLGDRELDEPASPPAASQPASESPTDTDWLKSLQAETPETRPPQPAADENPEWLKEFDNDLETPIPKHVSGEVEETSEPPMAESELRTPPVNAPEPAANFSNLGTTPQEQDDAMAWLESLAAKHGANPEELVTDPDARSEVAPEWVDKAREVGEEALSVPEQPRPAAPSDEDQTGIWLRNLEASESESLISRHDARELAKPNAPDWRSVFPDQGEFTETASEAEKEETPIMGEQDTPEWLSDLNHQPEPPSGTDEEIPDWLRPAATPVAEQPEASVPQQPSPEPESAVNLPDWLAGLDQEDTMTPPPAVAAEDLPSWLHGETEPEPEATERARPTDWQPVATQGEQEMSQNAEQVASSESEAEPVMEEEKPVRKAPPRQQGQVSVATRRGSEVSLPNAQSEIGRGNIAAALDIYGRLIRKGRSLEEIIRDLRDALYRYPVEVPIWQALGDAYMRANRLQEALDAYTKAEELLR